MNFRTTIAPQPTPRSMKGFSIRVNSVEQQSAAWISYNRLALVCEGGGQRGIFTAGILDTFMKHEFFPFQVMIGVSAGAQNLSAYACRAHGYAQHAILHYTTSQKFFDPLRFARGGHLIDLDWYFDALRKEVPLDLDYGGRRLEGRSLDLCVSCCDTLQASYLPLPVQQEQLEQSVKASSAIPLLYRRGVAINGVAYFDGGVADPLPVEAAHARGGDCIVVIRTVPRGPESDRPTLADRLKCGRLRDAVAVAESHLASYRRAQAFIARPPGTVKVIEIAPSQPLKSRVLCSSESALRHDYDIGRACGRAFLEHYAWRLRCKKAAPKSA